MYHIYCVILHAFEERSGDVKITIKVIEGESMRRERRGTIAAAVASGVGIAVIDEFW